MDNIQLFLRQLTDSVANDLAKVPAALWREAEELRLRRGYPALLISGGKEYTVFGQVLEKIEQNTLNNLINRFLNYSDYAHLEELRRGYVALPGGHRVGFSGQAVMEQGNVTTIRDMTSINIRFARDIPDAVGLVWPKLMDSDGRFPNTVIVSPPGYGKTTLLRSLIRFLSEHGYTVSVCDERNEISGSGPDGFSFDLGRRTDIMTGCSKEEGMIMMLRSMGPQILATDEVGLASEVQVLRRVVAGGVKLLTTVHGSDFRDVLRGPMGPLVNEGVVQRIVFLTDQPKRGTVSGIWRSERAQSSR